MHFAACLLPNDKIASLVERCAPRFDCEQRRLRRCDYRKRIKNRTAARVDEVRPKPKPGPAAAREIAAGRAASFERAQIPAVEQEM